MDFQLAVENWGHPAVFALVLGEFLGLPIPSALAVGAAAALPGTPISPAALVAVACAAALTGDSVWYLAGRARGEKLLEFYCRVTLGSAACPRRTRGAFERFGALSLVGAKFVPGLSTFAAPMAGLLRIPYLVFLAWDALGSALWAGVFVLVGRTLGTAVLERWGASASLFGGRAAALITVGAAAFIVMKWIRRRRLGSAEDAGLLG